MILEGIGVGFLTGLLVSVFRLGLEKAESLRDSVLDAAKTGGQMLILAFAALLCAYLVVCYCGRKVPLAGHLQRLI